MTSIFKTSCLLYWLIWLSILSFLIAMEYYQDRYSYMGQHDYARTLMTSACIIGIVSALLGCCCTKFDVMHICCAILYLSIAFVGLSVTCILVVTSGPSVRTYSETELLRKVIEEYKHTNKIPYNLYQTQLSRNSKCCGIIGFKDYRAFMLNASGITEDVPVSCCRQIADSQDGELYCQTDKGTRFSPAGLFTGNMSDFPVKLPKNETEASKVLREFYGSHIHSPNFTDPNLKLQVDVKKIQNIYHVGCYDTIKRSTKDVHDIYFSFGLTLLGCSVFMAILFVRNCLKARQDRRERLKEVLLSSAPEAPKLSLIPGDFTDEEQQQILHDLAYMKKSQMPEKAPPPPPTLANRPDYQARTSVGSTVTNLPLLPNPTAPKRR